MTDDDPNRSEKTFFGAQLILLQYRFFSEHSNEDSSGSVKVVIVTGRSESVLPLPHFSIADHYHK